MMKKHKHIQTDYHNHAWKVGNILRDKISRQVDEDFAPNIKTNPEEVFEMIEIFIRTDKVFSSE
jgi:hypothetical protein